MKFKIIYYGYVSKLVLILCCVVILVNYILAKESDRESDYQLNDYTGNLPYISPTPGEFPIIALHPCVLNHDPRIEEFKGVQECGFNAAIFNGLPKDVRTVAGYAEESKINLIIGSEILRSDSCLSFIKQFKSYPIITGWYLKDEPKIDDFESIKKYYDQISQEDRRRMVRINLIGGLTKGYTGNFNSYTAYIDTIQDIFKPGVWSYDYYPIAKKGDKIIVNYDSFYSDLENYSKISKLTNRPFWTHCQSMSFKDSHIERPEATEEYLRFQIFNSLAYGAQGIIYWTYTQRQSKKTQFFSALVNIDRKRTKSWYFAKNINGEIKLFSKVFLNSKLMDCVHSGTKQYKNTKCFENSFGPIEKMDCGKAGFLFSHLKTDGQNFLVVINHDVKECQKISISFKDKYRIYILSREKRNNELSLKETFINKNYNYNVQPSDYLIFRWEE